MNDDIIVKGAREHNLRDVSLTIPKNTLTLFTGVSGSGKSSMAFDTIYAEGQRRYVESLSSYARQFLGIMSKPDVDSIEGLSPAISIDQKTRSSNPRSTVGTITEIYDYLRLLYAKIATPYCPHDGTRISKLSADEITRVIMEDLNKSSSEPLRKVVIVSPIVREKKGEFTGLFANLQSKGFSTVIVDKQERSLDDEINLIKTNKHSIELVIDSVQVHQTQLKDKEFSKQIFSRIFQAVEQAVTLSDGLVIIRRGDEDQLFSQHYACPVCGFSLPEIEPRMFSFNSPLGACESCKGLGYIQTIDQRLVLNSNLTIMEGGVLPFNKIFLKNTWFTRTFMTFLEEEEIPTNVRLSEVSEKMLEILLYGSGKKYRVLGKNRFGKETMILEEFHGVIGELEKQYNTSQSEYTRMEIERYMNEETCPRCQGRRLKKEVLSILLWDEDIITMCEHPIEVLLMAIEMKKKKLTAFEKEVAHVILREITARLTFLKNVGLGYLTLNRSAGTLSGGESQRIRLASQIGSGLSGVIYVLDEPSIGLHTRDVSALIDSLQHLKNLGNTIVVVEHDTDTIRAADFIIDFGPKAGKHGGQVTFAGNLRDFAQSDTLTAKYLFQQKMSIQKLAAEDESKKVSTPMITLTNCSQFNLKGVTVSFPLNRLTCVTGVSGSGKSTLIVETLYKALRAHAEGWHKGTMGMYERMTGQEYIDKVYLVDQSPIGKTPRSNPATYIGVFDYIRDIFSTTQDAKIRGYGKGRFSFNVKGGRCEKCQGGGTIKIEMQFLPDVYVTCDVCQGKRYNVETLEVRYKDKSIYDILCMTVEEAVSFFDAYSPIKQKLQTLLDVGLGYIELGQPAPTLSGGEAQRIKLAHELSKKNTGKTVYILDEPTTGLHLYDVEKLLNALYRLVDQGSTIVVIEHNLEFVEHAQYIIDMGPEGGSRGGKVLYQGPLEGIYDVKDSYTGDYLKKIRQ
ncbi:MAG: UvrABC system protein A [Microgenomates bacterium OLB22]|nr:MAG: UvrABC system protein A [Microgenomates bacterium OLB22]